MRTLLPTITDLKNQIAVSGAWLTLMDIVDSAGVVKHRYVNDTYDLVYPTDDNTYSAASFQVQQISEEVQMSLPKITVNIYDPELNLKDELQANEGMSGWTIVLRRVYKATGTGGLVTDVNVKQEFTILDVAMADTVISLSIGIADPLARRFPRDNYGALTCRHKFKGGFCRYNGNLIQNPSFETGGMAPWRVWGLPSKRNLFSDQYYDGSWSYGHRADSHNSGSYQTNIKVEPNTTYTLSCWIYMINYLVSTATLRAMSFAVSTYYSTLLDKTKLNQWQQVSVTFTTGITQKIAAVWLGGIGECYFDAIDMHLTQEFCTHTLENNAGADPTYQTIYKDVNTFNEGTLGVRCIWQADYLPMRDAFVGNIALTDKNSLSTGRIYIPLWQILRPFASFAIPDMHSLTRASLLLYGISNKTQSDFEIYILSSTYSNPLVEEDFDLFDGHQASGAYNGIVLNDTWDGIEHFGWYEIIFNQIGRANIFAKKNSVLKIILISKDDYNAEPPHLSDSYISFASSYYPSKTPYLSLTYTEEIPPLNPSAPGCRKLNNSHQFGGSPGAAEGIFYDRR